MSSNKFIKIEIIKEVELDFDSWKKFAKTERCDFKNDENYNKALEREWNDIASRDTIKSYISEVADDTEIEDALCCFNPEPECDGECEDECCDKKEYECDCGNEHEVGKTCEDYEWYDCDCGHQHIEGKDCPIEEESDDESCDGGCGEHQDECECKECKECKRWGVNNCQCGHQHTDGNDEDQLTKPDSLVKNGLSGFKG